MLLEPTLRRDDWTEGTWIELSDGQRWCFPPHESVPGHDDLARDLGKEFIDNLMPLTNPNRVANDMNRLNEGDPSGAIDRFTNLFAGYRIFFKAGCSLLKANYHLDDDQLADLMPFDFRLDDPDVRTKVDAFGPHTALMVNSIGFISGIDIGPMMARISISN